MQASNTQSVDLHGLNLAFETSDPTLAGRFKAVYGHLPPAAAPAEITIHWRLVSGALAPAPATDRPVLSQTELISYYGDEQQVTVRLPKYALVTIDLDTQHLTGLVTQRCLDAYGVFEDVMMITLAPLYRRRGWYPLHAFAAQAPNGRGVLLSGDIGAGKTTTGLALLDAGWQLLSNDSPLLAIRSNSVEVLAYPGRLSAYDDSLRRFTRLHPFLSPDPAAPADAPQKRVFRLEEAFPQPWATRAPVGAIYFPRVVPGLARSRRLPLSGSKALLQLIPQAIESWDKPAIARTLHLLRRLVEQAPAYRLELAPDMTALPELIAAGTATSLENCSTT